jgi:hypothetical protein
MDNYDTRLCLIQKVGLIILKDLEAKYPNKGT